MYYWNRGGCTSVVLPDPSTDTTVRRAVGSLFIFGLLLLAGLDCACGSALLLRAWWRSFLFRPRPRCHLAPPADRFRSCPGHDATVRPGCASPLQFGSRRDNTPISPVPLSSISFALFPVCSRLLSRLSLSFFKLNVYVLIAARSSGRDPSSELGSHPSCTIRYGSYPWEF